MENRESIYNRKRRTVLTTAVRIKKAIQKRILLSLRLGFYQDYMLNTVTYVQYTVSGSC